MNKKDKPYKEEQYDTTRNDSNSDSSLQHLIRGIHIDQSIRSLKEGCLTSPPKYIFFGGGRGSTNALATLVYGYVIAERKEWLKVIEDIKAEIETLNISSMGKLKIGEIIDRKVNEVKGDKE